MYHDLITRRSITGILHLANKTPIGWHSKKQATVETATYGSKFIAAQICIDQSIDLKNTLCYHFKQKFFFCCVVVAGKSNVPEGNVGVLVLVLLEQQIQMKQEIALPLVWLVTARMCGVAK